MPQKTVTVSTCIPTKLRVRMKKAIELGVWLNESDFIRDLIREKLDALGIEQEQRGK